MIKPAGIFKKFHIKIGCQESGRIDKRWILVAVLAAVFICALFLLALIFFFEAKYAHCFYPGSRIGAVSLEGLTPAQALSLIDPITTRLDGEGITIIYPETKQTVKLADTVGAFSDPDLSRDLLNFDNHRTVYEAYDYTRGGRGWQWFSNVWLHLEMLFGSQNFTAKYSLDEAQLDNVLRQEFAALEKPGENARPQISCQDGSCRIEIAPEAIGLTFRFDEVKKKIRNNLSRLSEEPIIISPEGIVPEITKEKTAGLKPAIQRMLAKDKLEFFYEENKWNLEKKDLAAMIVFATTSEGLSATVDKGLFFKWLDAGPGKKIDMPMRNADLEIKDGKIISLSTHQAGQEIDREKVQADFQKQLSVEGAMSLEIAIRKIEPDVATENVNDLGIKEIIGTGQSSFAGSPSNRRYNIKNGAGKLHGVLIKPEEEFSLIQTLGPVESYTGYLPELVIKGNKTTPEYGGGLCQVGTTMFRAAMASGLPILERQNHSYSVTYYLENGLPGVDATIYIPKPDVRFKNDTGHYILIQRRIEGDKLFFDFWGTKDGRVATRTKPSVWGWISPAPTKYVETLDLKPGQKKCTESSHKGVNASFDYSITYPSGEIKKQTFTSHYKPWQAVCLIGVDKLSDSGDGSSSTPPSAGSSSSTVPTINPDTSTSTAN